MLLFGSNCTVKFEENILPSLTTKSRKIERIWNGLCSHFLCSNPVAAAAADLRTLSTGAMPTSA